METFENHFVIFKVEGQDYAVNLLNVERVVRAAQITRLPSEDPYILGVVDVQGEVLQVLNTRRFLGAPDKDIDISDQFIISRTTTNKVIIVADSVYGVYDLPSEDTGSLTNRSGASGFIRNVGRFGDSLVLVIDIETLVFMLDQNNPKNTALISN